MTSRILRIIVLLAVAFTGGCMKYDYTLPGAFDGEPDGRRLLIANEGNFMYGNATLSYYDPAERRVENEVFYRANGMRLGDVAQSIIVRDTLAWVVVNNSHVVFALSTRTFREVGRITGFTSPRYIHFVDEHKAYVTQLWDNRIVIVDPARWTITGSIATDMEGARASTEQMASWGDYLFVGCWSYQNRVLVVDTKDDRVVGTIPVGRQPSSLVVDARGKLWVLCDGGYEGSPYGEEAPSLWRIDAATCRTEQTIRFPTLGAPSELQTNAGRDTLYYIDGGVWRMPVTAEHLPARPFFEAQATVYYGLTVDPQTSEVYVADAIDYMQPGAVYRISPEGAVLDTFRVGVIPGAFAWKGGRP